jgi:hypothetical protein
MKSVKCDICGKLYDNPYLEFTMKDNKGWSLTKDLCSHKCMIECLKSVIRLEAGCDDIGFRNKKETKGELI